MFFTTEDATGGADDDATKKFQSRELKDFNFVAAGDFGCSDIANKTIVNMMSKKPELVLALGDLSYLNNADCWFSLISPLDSNGKVRIVIGEHDVADNPSKYNQYLDHFNLTKPYYSFDYQNVHFLVMATAKNKMIPYLNDSEQYEFVVQDLKKAHNNNSIDWIIVSSFRPFYSSISMHPGLDKLQHIYHQLFDRYDVDIVLQAHNHNYQRTYPISYNEIKHFVPLIMDKHVEEYDKIGKGQIFFTVGTGGAELYDFTNQAPYVVRQFLHHGFLNVDVTDNGLKLTGTFYDNKAMRNMDYVTISKN